jgi:hypothetical protein
VKQVAVKAKISALTGEFEELQEKSRELPYWDDFLWAEAKMTLDDWFLADAWYRSRCLELPHSGEAMVPVLDLANHSSEATAFYEENIKTDEVELLLRPGAKVNAGEQVTISYGEGKSGAEMLFSYGFIDPARSTDAVTLPLAPLDDDPLGRAKAHIFGRAGTAELGRTSGSGGGCGDDSPPWKSPFAWLACLNEEDGLEFRVLQDTGGGRELRVFWQDDDVTDRVDAFEELVRDHPLSDIFALRVVMVLEDRVSSQLARLRDEGDNDNHHVASPEGTSFDRKSPVVRPACVDAAAMLKEQETKVIEEALRALEEQVSLSVSFSSALSLSSGSASATVPHLASPSGGPNIYPTTPEPLPPSTETRIPYEAPSQGTTRFSCKMGYPPRLLLQRTGARAPRGSPWPGDRPGQLKCGHRKQRLTSSPPNLTEGTTSYNRGCRGVSRIEGDFPN